MRIRTRQRAIYVKNRPRFHRAGSIGGGQNSRPNRIDKSGLAHGESLQAFTAILARRL